MVVDDFWSHDSKLYIQVSRGSNIRLRPYSHRCGQRRGKWCCGCCSWKLGTERAESWWKKAEESAGLVQADAENDASNSLGVCYYETVSAIADFRVGWSFEECSSSYSALQFEIVKLNDSKKLQIVPFSRVLVRFSANLSGKPWSKVDPLGIPWLIPTKMVLFNNFSKRKTARIIATHCSFRIMIC